MSLGLVNRGLESSKQRARVKCRCQVERLQIFPELLKEAEEKRLTENFAHVSILKIAKIKHLYSLLYFCCYVT